jgi:hypothetical protein
MDNTETSIFEPPAPAVTAEPVTDTIWLQRIAVQVKTMGASQSFVIRDIDIPFRSWVKIAWKMGAAYMLVVAGAWLGLTVATFLMKLLAAIVSGQRIL